ncbi:hypothetical protein E3T43_07265 [Cryobacterium sp. Hh7]|uniref:hypothetical protein n=1 Tax=Cryobacterium sp. Hh7 TaxID=1259159 RepID=UPI001069DBA7|nr:hypothetical protein [Cryobacterium sp. Hh7]TFD58038.1 hypothetical protein E3T43_07265 [Cryobacterium sp. Hh7]
MGLRNYEYRGSTWQFDEGKQPEGAKACKSPAAAETVHVKVDAAAIAAAKALTEAEAAAAKTEAEKVAAEEAAVLAAAEAEKSKTPLNKAATPATK